MAELERIYNVPLRKGVMKAPGYMRANKAIRVLRKFLERHMKSNLVKIGPYLNSRILEDGRKHVPHHVEVKVVKDKDGVVKAEYLKAKNLDFLKPKEEKKVKDEVKLKIPGFGKKKEGLEKKTETKEESKEILTEKDKKEILEHKGKPLLTQSKPEKIPEIKTKDKEKEVMTKEDKVYGRFDKKPKVKERGKKTG